MSQLQDLAALQAIDNEVNALRAALADVQLRMQGDSELDEARRVVQAGELALQNLRREQRRVEGDVQGLTARIAPEDKRLYDGSVKNPKELTNIQHELELLKAQRSLHEDELLDVMSRIEAADREFEQNRKRLAKLESRWELHHAELRLEARRLEDAITLGDQKRERAKAPIPPRSLAVYEDLRRRKGGMAVAKLQGGVCQGCRILVPDAVRRKVFSPALLGQCPSCERILTVG